MREGHTGRSLRHFDVAFEPHAGAVHVAPQRRSTDPCALTDHSPRYTTYLSAIAGLSVAAVCRTFHKLPNPVIVAATNYEADWD
jgi:hypothetical protein